MKFKAIGFLGILMIAVSMWAILITANNINTQTVETSLTAANRYTYDAMLDSINLNLDRHYLKTANHDIADVTTDSVTGSAVTLRTAVTYARALRTGIRAHLANAAAHSGGADITTVVPADISATATYAQTKTFTDSLVLCMNAHFRRTISTRYNILGKEFTADFIAHAAKDTSDTDSVHKAPDTTWNTVTYDSTNIDSSYASWNRLKSRFNGHAASTTFHLATTRPIETPNATSRATLYALVNALRTAYNAHAVDLTKHVKADSGLITGAAVTVGGGHIAADAKTWTGAGHIEYAFPNYSDQMKIQYTGSSVSTGASFYHYGSVDGITYAFIDSTSVTANGAVLKSFTSWYPYMKIYCNKRTDGTYKIQLRAGSAR
jgi:hypothetical protein